MNDIEILLKGIAIGLAVSMPVGPIAILIMHRTLDQGRVYGLATGFGAASADGLAGILAAFGVGAISIFVSDYETAIRFVGGSILLLLAIRIWNTRPRKQKTVEEDDTHSVLGAYFTGLGLTLSNPMTILGFAAVFAGFGMAEMLRSIESSVVLVLGVFTGAAAWWFLLSLGVSHIRHYISEKAMRVLNHTSAVVMALVGVYGLTSAILSFIPVALAAIKG